MDELIARLELPSMNPSPQQNDGVHPQVFGKGARRSRRFDVARSPALAEYSKSLDLLTPRRPQGRAPRNRHLADELETLWQFKA
jgi:hypothetical protein